jgi:hypothetical protein
LQNALYNVAEIAEDKGFAEAGHPALLQKSSCFLTQGTEAARLGMQLTSVALSCGENDETSQSRKART